MKSLEQRILAALAARSGGDPVHGRNSRTGILFRLASGIHDMRAIARELAAQRAHVDAKWMRRFDHAWRLLCDDGLLEAPSMIPVAEVFPACQLRVHYLDDGTYIDVGRNRLYVRLTGRPAPPPRPAAVCRECGVDLPTTNRSRKWCAGCKAKLIKHRNVKARAERKKRRRIQLAGARCECCGTKFSAARSNQRYCSLTCNQRAYRQRKAKLGKLSHRRGARFWKMHGDST